MNNLEVREVNFNGNELLAAKSNDDGGISWLGKISCTKNKSTI